MLRNNAVVYDNGDKYRDTVALTVRGDGIDIPPHFITHTYKNASYASGRRCPANQEPVKGMNAERMIEYIDYLSLYVFDTSLLLLDRLSSHSSNVVKSYIENKLTPTGDDMFIPIYLPGKTSFLISPLDMGAIGAFKSHFHKRDRSTLDLKKKAVVDAWGKISNAALVAINLNCGIIGEESLDSLSERFRKEVVGIVPPKHADLLDFFESWASGAIDVEGAHLGRGVNLDPPLQLIEGHMDGNYWTHNNRQPF